jgi:hypothetical protein
MKDNPISKGTISNNFRGVGAVTRHMIDKRACELALLAGRPANEVTDADFDQAERELSGGHEMDKREEAIEALPESERWDPLPGSPGYQPEEVSNEDEDSEGRSEVTQLVEEGVREAEHDQMVQAEETAEDDLRGDAN